MYPTTGYTKDITQIRQLRNRVVACIQNKRAATDADGREYWRNQAIRNIRVIAQLRTLSAAQAADVDNATVTARLEWLESAIDEAAPNAVPEILAEIIELRNRLQLDGWADEQADGRMMARNLSDTY